MIQLSQSDEDRLREVLERSRSLGFLGPQPVDVQINHSLAFSQSLQTSRNNGLTDTDVNESRRILDLGSGGGLPGLVIQAVFKNDSVLLLDAMAKRVTFLESAIEDLNIGDRVSAKCARAEEAAHEIGLRNTFDIVVARSFGKPALAAECARGFLKSGGQLIVSEPPQDHGERWPKDAVSSLGYLDLGRETVVYSDASGTVTAHIRRLEAVGPPAKEIPRSATALKKRPLW